jgi:hypothetical protein
MRKIRLTLGVSCLLLLMAGSSFAQSGLPQASHKFDEVTGFNCEDMMARLDNFAIELQNNPSLLAFLLVYGGNRGLRGEAQAWAGRAKYYLSSNRGIDAARIMTKVGGYRERHAMELWLLRGGALPPVATPTIKLKDIRFKRGRIKKSQYRECGEV